MSSSNALPTEADVIAAAQRIHGYVRRTGILESHALNERVGGRVLLKPENLQITGSFKARGVYNKLLLMPPAVRRRGIVAWSAGNHGQALAFVGRQFDVPVTIVMPSDAPEAKVAGTRGWGATIRFYDRVLEDREAIGWSLAEQNGAVVVPPYDDGDVIAGQGTAGLELVDQAGDLGLSLDKLVAPVGGGGLIAGCALAMRARGLAGDILSAEPVGFDDTRRSLIAGKRVANDPAGRSSADALLTTTPGVLTFELNRRLLAGGFALEEEQIAEAVRFAFADLRLVLEPGGAAALACILAQPDAFRGATTGLVLTGGNVDAKLFRQLLRPLEARPLSGDGAKC